MNHFTNRQGYNGIRSASTWRFRASQPPRPAFHPFGAYFTTLAPETPNLAVRLGIPKSKLAFLFAFADAGDLRPLPDNDRGEWIYYSPSDYHFPRDRQISHGETGTP